MLLCLSLLPFSLRIQWYSDFWLSNGIQIDCIRLNIFSTLYLSIHLRYSRLFQKSIVPTLAISLNISIIALMSDKLKELTEHLYRKGVEQARQEADSILSDAENERQKILSEARAEAESIISHAQTEVDSLRKHREAEISLAARHCEGEIKTRITNLLSQTQLNEEIGRSIANADMMIDLVKQITDMWASGDEVPEPRIILAAGSIEDFQERLKSALKEKIASGLSLEISDKFRSGFRIEAADGSYAMSFTEDDFREYFRSFFKEETKKILFGER